MELKKSMQLLFW